MTGKKLLRLLCTRKHCIQRKVVIECKIFVNIYEYLVLLLYLLSHCCLLCCGRNRCSQLFEPKAKNTFPSFCSHRSIFSLKTKYLHRPRSFIWNEAASYSTKHFVTGDRHLLCFLLMFVLYVMMMILRMSNECLYECKTWCDETCKSMPRTHPDSASP